MENKVQKLKINTIVSLLNKLVTLLAGLILPRLILLNYGSEVNGLTASINQFLSVITFLDLGVGSVVQSELYKPLVESDTLKINKILTAAKIYFRRIAYILVVYIIILSISFPYITENNSFDKVSTIFLIISMSISMFARYYFGIINEFLLNADQRSYVQLGSEIVVVVLNLLACILFIRLGFTIQFVKLASSLVFLIRPIYLNIYVKNNFDIDLKTKVEKDPLPQKWGAMGQHIAYSIQNSTDIVVLTFFSTLENISIYSVYNLVVQAISTLIQAFTTGLTSFFGNLLAANKLKILNSYFFKIEWGIHTVVTVLYGMTSVLISPFVLLYTHGIQDVNYYAPTFSLILVIAKGLYSIRIPYQAVVFAAGHYKQTQVSSIIEALINITVSLIGVNYFGLVGVTIGSLSAMTYRTMYLTYYLSKNILVRKTNIFIKQMAIDFILFISIFNVGNILQNFNPINNFYDWILISVMLGLISLILTFIINLFFYRNNVLYIIKKITNN